MPPAPFDPSLVDLRAVSVTPALEQQAWQSARQLAASMTPAAFLNLAMTAAMKVTDEATENWDAEAMLSLVQDEQPLEESPLLDGLYDRLEPHLARPLPTPLLSTHPLIGEGLHAGTQILLNPLTLTDPSLALFVMAHEAAHAEGRHTVRRRALEEAEPLLGRDNGSAALQEAKWQLEYEADARATELSAKAGIGNVRSVLKTLMESPQGEEHPDGYQRAVAVRDRFRTLGVEVTDACWQSVVDETQPGRDAHRRKQQEEESLRRLMARLV